VHLSSTFLGTGSAGPGGSDPDGEGTARATVWRNVPLSTVRHTEYRPNKENHGVRIYGTDVLRRVSCVWTDATVLF